MTQFLNDGKLTEVFVRRIPTFRDRPLSLYDQRFERQIRLKELLGKVWQQSVSCCGDDERMAIAMRSGTLAFFNTALARDVPRPRAMNNLTVCILYRPTLGA